MSGIKLLVEFSGPAFSDEIDELLDEFQWERLKVITPALRPLGVELEPAIYNVQMIGCEASEFVFSKRHLIQDITIIGGICQHMADLCLCKCAAYLLWLRIEFRACKVFCVRPVWNVICELSRGYGLRT